MRMAYGRKLLAAVLAAGMILGMTAEASAANGTRQSAGEPDAAECSFATGLLKAKPMELDLSSFEGSRYAAQELAKGSEEPQSDSLLKASQIYEDDWDKYSTNYYYNQMNDDQRELWDALDVMCLNYLVGRKDLNYYRGSYLTDYVYSPNLSNEEVLLVTQIFRYSNPQYYYLEPFFYTAKSSGSYGAAMMVYEVFADGSDRAAATKKFEQKIESWMSIVESYSTDYGKVKAIHDLICDNTTYNYSAVNFFGSVSGMAEQRAMTQSAYSTFVLGTTVCAGYAQACELLCNGAGIDAIVVTSEDHEWNKVRLEDSWYNVDCTWDDTDSGTGYTYTYFTRSDNAYDNGLQMQSSHQEESMWESYLPKCTLDSGSTAFEAGTLPVITETTGSVVISAVPVYEKSKVSDSEYIKSYKVTMSCATEGAEIYYTTDGQEPSVASGKSRKYTDSFHVSDASQVSAVAVCDQKYDSIVSVDDSVEEVSYPVNYVTNGGKNSAKNPDSYKASDADVTLQSPTRTGYQFAGWYTSSDFSSSKVKKIAQGSTGELTLYAKWMPVTYKIKYNGNGAKSGSMSAKSCKYGSTYTLAANKFKRTGYTFAGWNTKKNGTGKTYKNKAKIKNLTTKAGRTITLYAQWKKKK